MRRVHIIGDRRDRFEALKDVMETFRVIMAERKRREMDPTIALLEHCVREAKAGDESEQYTREQLEKMLEFTRMVTAWYSQIDNLSTPALLRLFRGGAMLAKLFTPRQACAPRRGREPRRPRPASSERTRSRSEAARQGRQPRVLRRRARGPAAAGGGVEPAAAGAVGLLPAVASPWPSPPRSSPRVSGRGPRCSVVKHSSSR